MMRLNLFVLSLILFNSLVIPQQDSTKEKPTQYRRGIELNKNQQSYEEKYADKNLNEEKRSLFPLEDSTGVWTELNPKVPRVTYLGIHFFNPDTGWFVGDLGAVIKTINGGEDWTISQSNTTTLLLKVNSFDGQIVIATGYNGFILRSTDGGENFTQVTSGVGSGIDLWGLQMLNDTLGFVCGLNQTLLKTTDTDLTWQPVNTGLNQHYWALDFLDENFGMIACGGGKILKTIDGGLTWTEHQSDDASDLFAIDIIDTLNIAAAGLNGKNVYSSDGGVSWIQNNRLQHDELNSIKFFDTETGYTIGIYQGESWGIRKTTNRGVTWFTPLSPNLSDWELELLPGGIGYSAGSNLWINKTIGGYDNWNGLFLNANFVDVYFTDELTGYAADGTYTGGPLYKTTDGGLTWFGLPNFPSQVFTSSLRSVTFADSLTGFAGSAPARIVKTTDAGNSWYIVNRTGLTDTIGLINRFFFINPNTGWAVTTRGGILKTTDAGENWFAQLNAGISVIFRSIHFVDSLYGWTANSSRRPHKTTDGGNNWMQQTNLNFYDSNDIFFINSDSGFVIESNF
ncbi:MAG TPA: YCF48-related protein, partial [Mariniflexile sp.]